MLLRALALCLVFLTPGISPALAWAQPASDPCNAGDLSHHAQDEPHGEHPEDEPCVEDCRAACACPCCPVRVSFGAPHLAPSATSAAPGTLAQVPFQLQLEGTPREIFHPPSR